MSKSIQSTQSKPKTPLSRSSPSSPHSSSSPSKYSNAKSDFESNNDTQQEFYSNSKNSQNIQNSQNSQNNQNPIFYLELSYDAFYKKTIKEQLELLKKHDDVPKFKNTWRDSIKNVIRVAGLVAYGIHIPFGIYSVTPESIGPKLSTIIAGGALALLYFGIPIPSSKHNKEALLYVPPLNKGGGQFKPNNIYSKDLDSVVEFKIPEKSFNQVLISIAETYDGEHFHTDVYNSNLGIRTIVFKFSSINLVDEKVVDFDRKIKQFLYSLPSNVSLMHVYKLRDVNSNVPFKKNDRNELAPILYPRLDSIPSLIPQNELTGKDINIITHAQSHQDLFDKAKNKNSVTLKEKYLKPLAYFTPKRFRKNAEE